MDEVLRAIETVAAGGTYFCEEVLRSLASRMQTAVSGYEGSDERLSTREIGDSGLRVPRAVEPGDRRRTVHFEAHGDKHRANILEKTGCKNTASLVVYAVRHGLWMCCKSDVGRSAAIISMKTGLLSGFFRISD